MKSKIEKDEYLEQVNHCLKHSKDYSENPNAPVFKTLFWDNFKTSTVYGAYATGSTTGFIGGLAGGLFGAACGAAPVTAVIGAVVTGIPTAIGGGLMGALLSPLFTLQAMQTRKFQTNDNIEPAVNLILSFTSKHYQQFIIDKILEKYEQHEWWRFISSYESRSLINNLTSGSIESKWKALTTYLKDMSYFNPTSYLHNGKKTFNLILAVAVEEDLETRKELEEAISKLDEGRVKGVLDKNPWLIEEHTSHAKGFYDSHGKNLFQTYFMDNKPAEVQLLLNASPKDKLQTLLYQPIFEGNVLYPVHVAAKEGYKVLLEILLEKDPNQVNTTGGWNGKQTPLHFAAENGHIEIVDCLVLADANIDCKGKYSETALQLADFYNHKAVADYLVKAGAVDHASIQLKKELTILKKIIHDASWTQEISRFNLNFFNPYPIPNGVAWLRNTLKAELDIDTQTRDDLRELARTLRSHDFGTCLVLRSEGTAILYRLINNLGDNEKNFQLLERSSLDDFTCAFGTLKQVSKDSIGAL